MYVCYWSITLDVLLLLFISLCCTLFFTYPLIHLCCETCIVAVIVWHNMVTDGILLLDGSVLRNGSLKSHNVSCPILSLDISLLVVLWEEYNRSLAFTSLIGLTNALRACLVPGVAWGCSPTPRHVYLADWHSELTAWELPIQANMPVPKPNGPYICKTRSVKYGT